MGLGLSGTSAARALQASGARVWAWDDNEQHRLQAQAHGIDVQALFDHEWPTMTALVLNPSIPHTYPQPHPYAMKARAHGIPIVCDINFLPKAQPHAQYIGITGTNGKSTTTALIGHLLKFAGRSCQVGGNIGIAALSLDPFDKQKQGAFVLELSSYQLELTPDLCLDRAVLLNITPDHLSRHGGMAGYIEAKRNIFRHLEKNSQAVALVGIDDPDCEAIAQELQHHHRLITFSISKSAEIQVDRGILYDNGQEVMNLFQDSKLRGEHNAQNMAAAYGVGKSLNIEKTVLIQGLRTFQGLVHRQESLGKIKNIEFINDSKATNAEAVAKALACYDNIYWILGGQAKENGLECLDSFYPRIKHAFLIGEAMPLFEKQLKNKVPITACYTLEKATRAAFEAAQQAQEHVQQHAQECTAPLGKAVILLSPACASWDQFKSFEHRGEVFRTLFYDLKEKIST